MPGGRRIFAAMKMQERNGKKNGRSKKRMTGKAATRALLLAAALCLGGTAKAHIGYLDAEASNEWSTTGNDGGLTRWNVAVGYDYNLSKRTSVYTAAAYTKDDLDGYKANCEEPSSVEVMAGLIHKF